MKSILNKIFIIYLLLSATAIYAQVPDWQWGKRGGSAGFTGSTSSDNDDVIDMATDKNGNVYVLGTEERGVPGDVDGHTGIDIADQISLSSWDCNGNFRWVKFFGGAQGVLARSLGVDSLGGVYVTGSMADIPALYYPTCYFDTDTLIDYTNKSWYIIKYDTSGHFQWFETPEPDTVSLGNNSGALDMSVEENGNSYIYGYFNPGDFDNGSFIIPTKGMYVVQFNSAGIFQQLTPLDITVSGSLQQGGGYANMLYSHFSRDHHNGRFYLAGYYNLDYGALSIGTTSITFPSNFGGPIYLAAFDNNGNNLWVKQSIQSDSSGGGIFDHPAIDENSNIYISGAVSPGVTFDGYTFTNSLNSYTSVAFIIAVDSNGNLRWGSHGETESDATAGAMGIAYVNNTVNVTGRYGSLFNWDSLSVTGPYFIGSPPKYIYLARFNATTGNIIGLDSIPSNDFNTGASAITCDKNNNFYIGGQFANQLYPYNDTLNNIGGPLDWFVAKFGVADCNCTIPQPSFNYNNSGNAYNFNYTGSNPYTSISWDFGDDSPVSNNANPTHTYAVSGSHNVCVTVTNDCGSNTSCQTININGTGVDNIAFTNITIYPSPATQEITVGNATAGTILDIYNTTGSLMLHVKLKGDKDNVDINSLASGVYLMRFTDKQGRQGSSKFVKQ